MTEKQLRQYRDIKNERDHLQSLVREINVLRVERDPSSVLLRNYDESIRNLNNQLIAIENAIETLEPRERQAIRLHYIDGLTWEEVGYKMYYERSQIFRIRKTAIEKLKNV